MPQDPGNVAEPGAADRRAIEDMLDAHASARRGVGAVDAALASVHLPADPEFARRYPHQLSGGQQQRVTIATALVCEPPLVVLDEPTTGLDVVTQARILDEIDRLRRERGLAIVYVSHDLAVVSQIADRIAVMYAGRIVEEGRAADMLTRPRHPYTRGLVASIPDHLHPRRLEAMPGIAVGVGERPSGCAFAPRCPIKVEACDATMPELVEIGAGEERALLRMAANPCSRAGATVAGCLRPRAGCRCSRSKGLRAVHGGRREQVVAADDVSFELAEGECVALVGESGSGKTTIARCVAGLHAPAAGAILLDGEQLGPRAKGRSREQRRRIQIVFQNPYDSLNPRHRVGDAIARPARVLRDLSRAEAAAEVVRLLERVRLPARLAQRFPGELSGGERQRVAIARALAANPDLLVCDEITSALDVSVQAAVLELLAELRTDLRLSLLFITHDLGVVATIADRVLVLDGGVVCEQGSVDDVIERPQNEYTRRLVASAPRLPETRVA